MLGKLVAQSRALTLESQSMINRMIKHGHHMDVGG